MKRRSRSEAARLGWRARRVREWAELACSIFGPPAVSVDLGHERIAGVQGSVVQDINNEEEAFNSAEPLPVTVDAMRSAGSAPTRSTGGVRRVIVRCYVWEIDLKLNAAHHPSWITLGQGFSVRAAFNNSVIWVREWEAAARPSRVLRATVLEIAHWTEVPIKRKRRGK